MFNSEEAKTIGDAVRDYAGQIMPALVKAFAASIINERSEVRFFDKAIKEIPLALQSLQLPDLDLRVRVARVHQKPIVEVTGRDGFKRELADLLVMVKYETGNLTERKSLLYQVKLCESASSYCKIDEKQLALLSTWPRFEFGRRSSGGVTTYQVRPKTLEFGSYMLMLRGPTAIHYIALHPWAWCCQKAYGVCPYALEVLANGPKRVDISQLPHAGDAAEVFYRHLAFELGEHHDFNAGADELVAALYRYVGLDPDPPEEFEGYSREAERDEIGFAVIEIRVIPGEEFWGRRRLIHRRPFAA